MRLLPRKTPPSDMAHFEPLINVQVRKWDFVWRTLVFTILELAFLTLATFCLKPIPLLPTSISSRTMGIAKAITTTIAVVWHTIALFPIKDIISTVFSAECMAQHRRTGRLQSNTTDRVSCITSGWLAQISHFLTLRPTPEYRLAFFLVLSTTALIPLGPSVIGLNPSLITHHEDLQIANLTMSKGFSSPSQYQCITKADEIVYLEAVKGGTYGYKTQTAQTLIPWPNPGFENSQGLIKYESDVVVYDYICQWLKFRFNESWQVVITEMANISWIPWEGYFQTEFGSLFGMLYLSKVRLQILRPLGDVLPLLDLQDNPLPLSAFIFVYNDPKEHDPLGTVEAWTPTAIDKDMTSSTNRANVPTTLFLPGSMAATLLCDPHYTISRAGITLQDGQLHAILDEGPLLGNFPQSAANSLFSQAFLDVLIPQQSSKDLDLFPFTMGPGDNQTLLTLPEINNNMNKLIQSAAKAYITGFTGFNESQLGVFPSYTTFNQAATIGYLEISLVSSRPFLVALWVLDGVIVLILVILLCITNAREMWLFNLQTMVTIYRDLPTGDGDLSLPQHYPPDLNTTKLGYAWRFIVFVILEFSFLAFAGYCLANPVPVHLPSVISPSHAKSATTAIVVAWRTLAVFPIKDIILLVFSAECIAQYSRTGHLEPNITDRVSHATSGFMDQISHFLVGWPTLRFRLAFLLAVFVALIGPLGPGVVTLDESPATCSQDLLVANLSSLTIAFQETNRGEAQSVRAPLFVELELLEGRVYGYDTGAEGVLIPWPESGFSQSTNVTVYGSDIVVYNYSCHWPSVKVDQFAETIIALSGPLNGTLWTVEGNEMGNRIPSTEGVFPLREEVFRLPTPPPPPFPYFGVSFSGNSTLMDLTRTSTSVHFTPDGHPEMAMSLSVLICDPQYNIQRANVTLSGGKLSANILPTLPLLGNFPEDSASDLFSEALGNIFSERDPVYEMDPILARIFTGQLNGTGTLHPLPLPAINDNMNRALKSAAKAYLSGYDSSGNPLSILPSYKPWNQTATLQYQQLSLVASRPFLLGLLALVAVTVVILAVLLKVGEIGKVQLFNLQTLQRIYADELLTRDG